MSSLKILICGGGCAGPALAYWLARAGHKVTICERFEALRASGAQIDIRAQGIEAVRRMGLLETIRGKLVDEDGVSFVDAQGNVKGTLMANRSGKGAQSATSEYEIMRGDLVRILYDATKENVEYRFGMTVDSFEQDESSVNVRFSNGTSDTFDILVGADGQGSRIRKAILPADAPDPVRRLGVNTAYFFIPTEDGDTNIRRTYHAPGGRMIFRRTHSPEETQVYFFLRDDSEDMSVISRAHVDKQKEFWRSKFQDAGWQTDRFLKGMETTKDFYCQEVVQVKIDKWHKGRVVLLGDAAHCASPFSGMGTTGSFVGAYILASEINKSPQNLEEAFTNYDKVLRPFVNEFQKINTTILRLAMPETQWGITILHLIAGLLFWLRIPQLVARFSSEDKGGLKLPKY